MTATIEVKPSERKDVAEKINNPNYYPIEHKLIIKCVDFVDITEFNGSTIVAADFEKKHTDFVNAHSRLTPELMNKVSKVLEEAGLIVHFRESFGRRFDAQRSEREACMSILNAGGNLEELLKGATPPSEQG